MAEPQRTVDAAPTGFPWLNRHADTSGGGTVALGELSSSDSSRGGSSSHHNGSSEHRSRRGRKPHQTRVLDSKYVFAARLELPSRHAPRLLSTSRCMRSRDCSSNSARKLDAAAQGRSTVHSIGRRATSGPSKKFQHATCRRGTLRPYSPRSTCSIISNTTRLSATLRRFAPKAVCDTAPSNARPLRFALPASPAPCPPPPPPSCSVLFSPGPRHWADPTLAQIYISSSSTWRMARSPR